jgi:hypothetical protein
MTKIREGLYNKVFSLKMENGREVLARIPNPNAGNPQLVVASEVATLDFVADDAPVASVHSLPSQSAWAGLTPDLNHMQLRNVLDIPVPKVLSWSSPSQPNTVGAEYILMERINKRQLSEAWDTMSEAQRFGLVKSLVAIEQKLMSVKFGLHDSLYYKGTAFSH